jgi:hypothetical protein
VSGGFQYKELNVTAGHQITEETNRTSQSNMMGAMGKFKYSVSLRDSGISEVIESTKSISHKETQKPGIAQTGPKGRYLAKGWDGKKRQRWRGGHRLRSNVVEADCKCRTYDSRPHSCEQ